MNDESKNLLRNLIDQSLMVQKAKDEDVNVETDLIKRLDQMRKQDNLATIEDLQKDAEQQGVNWEDFKDQIRRQLLMQEVISRDVGSRIIVTREEARKYYNEHKDEFKSEGMVHLAEILISIRKVQARRGGEARQGRGGGTEGRRKVQRSGEEIFRRPWCASRAETSAS